MAKDGAKNSEVRAYWFIRDELKALGWDTRNPERHPAGQVYTQQECLANPEVKKYLGLKHPEYIVKVGESAFWVIEAKREHKELDKALEEAAVRAHALNQSKLIRVPFISGVAGNDIDGFFVRTRFKVNGDFKPITINGREGTSLVSPTIANTVLEGGPKIADVPIDEALFLSKAERINEFLHLGAINKDARARVMAALLLAMLEDTPPNIDASPSVLIGDINSRASQILKDQGKSEFARFIELALPASKDNHTKYKRALVQTIQELHNLNIRSAMNSGKDVLGAFYEVFLKYGNGAKEIGIVLTPRHITKFATEVLHITDRDTVYDPCCGTGGFLVAAFDYVRKTSTTPALNRFKERNLFGIDEQETVLALAITNMIFRGDGKNNIQPGDCFQQNLIRSNDGAKYAPGPASEGEKAVTRVLMNPPFPTKAGQIEEYKFVEAALGQMQDGGLLFSVLPYSTMVKSYRYKQWRKEVLLASNTLLSVITFPIDLFYPIGVHAIGIFVKKGIPHPPEQNVLWVRIVNDGFLKSKGKRLPADDIPNELQEGQDTVRNFLDDPAIRVEAIKRLMKACPIDFDDPLLELIPENYLDESLPSKSEIANGMDQVLRDAVAFMVQSGTGTAADG